MPNQYDALGVAYDATKSIPASLCHAATLVKHLGDVSGLRVLDLACGSGSYSRKMVAWGAEHVTAVDLSPGMINSAKEQTGADPRIKYVVADCIQPLADIPKASFDLVLGLWYLNYATNVEEITAMWRNVAMHLKPGGKFVGLRPTWDPEECEDHFGVSRKVLERIPGGFSRRTWLGPDREVNFVNYMLSWDIYQDSAARVGMQNLEVRPIVLPDGEEGNTERWKPFLAEPTFEVITASRIKATPNQPRS